MSFYRGRLLDAVRALADHGDLNTRLTHAAGYLLQIDDSDVPDGLLARFEYVRDPLIDKPMVSRGEVLPRDLSLNDAGRAAAAIVDLLATEMCKP